MNATRLSQRHFSRVQTALILLLAALCIPYADHINLDQGLPTRLEDAYPISYRDREVQVFFQYLQQEKTRYRMNLTPVAEGGFPINTQLEVEVPLIFGGRDKTGSGNIRPIIFYNFNMEGVFFPAIALEAAIDIPTGQNSHGVDPTFKLILTKTLRNGVFKQLHINGEYGLNAEPQENERRNLYTIVVGYSQRITANSILIFDFYRERGREHGKEENVLEAGTRTALDPFTVISLGAGFGIQEESPRFLVTIGLQRSLSGQFLFF